MRQVDEMNAGSPCRKEPLDLPRCFDELGPHIEGELARWLPTEEEIEPALARAMHYSVFGGGKRVRPVLALLACRAVSDCFRPALAAACAVELIHTYSLIHDDLPCMDDDDMRRGRPTSHRVFGEAMAVLTGDALLTLAFEVMADERSGYGGDTGTRMVWELARAGGARAMVGGQVLDIDGGCGDLEKIESLHSMKTGALFRASVRLGALAGDADGEELESLTEYARGFGLAFQITDDILDVVGDPLKTGRYRGSDEEHGKNTYPALVGLDESRRLAREAAEKGLEALSRLPGSCCDLEELMRFVLHREG